MRLIGNYRGAIFRTLLTSAADADGIPERLIDDSLNKHLKSICSYRYNTERIYV